MYTAFAQVYDRLMDEVDYEAWALGYERLLSNQGVVPGARVTECACGTGGLTQHLAKTYRMTGVDISEDMLSVAAAKLRFQGSFIPLIAQDMRALSLHQKQDALLCTCDGVNYLLDEKELLAFFASANQNLVDGGVFIMDLSTPYKLKEALGNNTLFESKEDIAYIWQNTYNEEERIVELSLDIFVKEGESYRRINELQKQRAWSLEELKGALKKAGFCLLAVHGNIGQAPHELSERWHISARKEK